MYGWFIVTWFIALFSCMNTDSREKPISHITAAAVLIAMTVCITALKIKGVS